MQKILYTVLNHRQFIYLNIIAYTEKYAFIRNYSSNLLTEYKVKS